MLAEATLADRQKYLQGDRGFIVYENGEKVAHVAYHTKHDGLFYAHSFESKGSPYAAVQLWQRVRRLAKRLGYPKVDFCISPEMPALLELIESKKAQMKQIWVEIPV